MKNLLVIGIAGGSAGGKSTFCDKLAGNLSDFKIKIFHIDDYFKPEEQRPVKESPVTEMHYMDDNHPDSVDFIKLKRELGLAMEENLLEVIIVEGLLTLWDKEIYAKLDLKLFVDCRADERIVRRLRRNMEWGLSFDEVSSVYLDLVRYRHDEYVEPSKWKADLIINGSNPSEKALLMISEYIKSKIIFS